MSFIRYLLVQGFAYGLDMGGFLLLLTLLEVGPLPANLVGKLLAVVFAYLAHTYFTFAVASGKRSPGQALKYFVLVAFNLPLSSLILSGMLQLIALPVLAKFLSDLVCLGFNYWICRKYVFVEKQAQGAAIAVPGNE